MEENSYHHMWLLTVTKENKEEEKLLYLLKITKEVWENKEYNPIEGRQMLV